MQLSGTILRPAPIISSTSSYVPSVNSLLIHSLSLLSVAATPTCMSPTSRNCAPTVSPWGRRRGPSNPHLSASIQEPALSWSPYRHLNRSVSETSPVSPIQPNDSSALCPPSTGGHIRRRPTRLSSISRRQRETETQSYNPEPQQSYVPYSPDYRVDSAPRSAPSLVTSFPDPEVRAPVQSTPSWPLPSNSGTHYSPSPFTMFSPVSSNPYDSWEYQSPQRSRAHTYMASPTSYAAYAQGGPGDANYQAGRDYSTSSAPGAMQGPFGTNSTDPSNYRRESEAVDEFTSPSEFALFVEATSSLSISPRAPSWSPTLRPSPSPSRLAAPLPPLPHQQGQTRSHSSPAPSSRVPNRQPSHSQLLAEALVGMDPEDSPDDDELPDYAQSQAEAHARQRREAARRAQELDEMWSRARRRRG